MAKFNIHAGHCPDGKGASGAVGILKESTEARKVKNKVIVLLKKEGHTAYDCTCDEKTTQSGCLTKMMQRNGMRQNVQKQLRKHWFNK